MSIADHIKQALLFKTDKPLFQTKDDHGDIFVFEKKGFRVLSFDERFEQSSLDLSDPAKPAHKYVASMLLVLAFHTPKKILHLGLGGGALLRSCHKVFPHAKQIAVELRAGVKLVAERYFLNEELLPSQAHYRIVCDNAKTYLSGQNKSEFSIIFSDIYMPNGMDISQKTTRYLNDCANALTDDGWLVINFTQLPSFNDQCFTTLGASFKSILVISVDTANHVVFAGKQELRKPLAAYAGEVKTLAEQLNAPLLKQFKHLQYHQDFYHID